MEDLKVLGLVIQGGSFGLLVAITFWLMRWIPRRLQELDAARAAEVKAEEAAASLLAGAHRAATDRLALAHHETCREMLKTFAEQQRYEREQCAHQFAVLMDGMTHQRDVIAKLSGTVDQSFALLREHHTDAKQAITRILTDKGGD